MKGLAGTLLFIGGTIAVLLLVLRQGFWGPVILLGLCVALYGVTFLSELWKLLTGKYSKTNDGKKVQDRDRNS